MSTNPSGVVTTLSMKTREDHGPNLENTMSAIKTALLLDNPLWETEDPQVWEWHIPTIIREEWSELPFDVRLDIYNSVITHVDWYRTMTE